MHVLYVISSGCAQHAHYHMCTCLFGCVCAYDLQSAVITSAKLQTRNRNVNFTEAVITIVGVLSNVCEVIMCPTCIQHLISKHSSITDNAAAWMQFVFDAERIQLGSETVQGDSAKYGHSDS